MQFYDSEHASELRAAFEDVVLDWRGVEPMTMFGCPAYRADGVLFALLVTEGVVLTRLPAESRETLEAAFETGPFSGSSRPPKQWVQVVVDAPAMVDLVPFVRDSYEAALAEAEAADAE